MSVCVLLLFKILCIITINAQTKGKAYDYIIVGAGSAGSVLAAKLSENSQNTVLLIEEGSDSLKYGDTISNAANYWDVLKNEEIERGYTSTPQTNVNQRKLPLYRAKVTGGCGAHYGMVWTLGNKNDFDEKWNITNWKWNDLKPYWAELQSKFEINHIKYDKYTTEFIKAAKQNGYEFNTNYSNLDENSQYGASLFQYSAKLEKNKESNKIYAKRQNSWTQFIDPIQSERDNLKIITEQRVNLILFDQDSLNTDRPKAIGVSTTNSKIRRYYANKEVIISAGTFDTPKLLLLSGIGDCDKYPLMEGERCKKKISGVGKNLQDHIHFMIESPPLKKHHNIVVRNKLPSFIYASDFRVILFDESDEHEFIFFIDWRQKKFAHAAEPVDIRKTKDGTIETFDVDNYDPDIKAKSFKLFVMALHLKSRGHVELIDNNPESPPLIDLDFLSDKEDEQTIIDLVKKGRELFYSSNLMDLYENVEDEILPGANIKTDKQILEWSKNVLLTDYHPVGTCKMGMDLDDENVVVDERLRVKGIDNLRIVDASIMPEIVSAHTNAAAMLIALRASDLILQDNKNEHKSEL